MRELLKTVRGRWWFWPALVGGALVIAWGAWYAVNYYQWLQVMEPYREQARQAAEYYEWKEEQREVREAMYRNDTHGGDTPEETLELFIEALEAEDYELASKYYIPEKQDAAFEDLEEAKFLQEYIEILTGARKEGRYFQGNEGRFEVNYYISGEQVHYERLIINEYTGKWKLEDF